MGQKPAFFVTMTDIKATENRVTALATDDLAAQGYELVRVQLTSGGRYMTLQVMAERVDAKPMTVDDCARISHMISARLDQDDPLAGRYTLEVSSPGIDRPLVRLKDFERFAGHTARIELEAPLGGQKRFQGNIVRVTGNAADAEIELKTETGAVRVPANAIARAKLVLTDALMRAPVGTKH